MGKRWITTTATGTFFALAAGGAAVAQSATEVASSALEEMHAASGAPAVSAAVWAGGDIAWAEALGEASVELGVPATPAHRFRLASVSKVVTAAVVARLVDHGVFDLDADVRTYVSSFPEKSGVVTTRLLLGHLAGVRHYTAADYDLMQPGGMIDLRLYPSTESALALFRDDDLIAPPGETYSYSTFAFTLIAAAIEGATGKPYSATLSEQVIEPLGLSSMSLDDIRAIVPDMAELYDVPQPLLGEPEDGGVHKAFPSNPAYKFAGGGILATPSDLVRFGAAHLEPGFLSEVMLREMMTSQSTTAGEETGVGLAWRVGEDGEGRRVWHHAGSQAGTRSFLMIWPDHAVIVAVCSNLSGTPPDIFAHGEAIEAGFLQ
jgi:serine beta-lactamase-like protein LACTB